MIQTVFSTLFEVIVPLSIPVIAGVLLVRFKGFESKQVLTPILYFMFPCMVFTTLFEAQITFVDLYKTGLFSLLNMVLLWAVAKIAGKMLRLSTQKAAGLTLVSTLTNSINYGLPLVLLAFGQAGLEKASIYVITQIILVNTVGVFFAARSNFSIRKAILSIFSYPAVYAAILAVILRAVSLKIPSAIETGIEMVAKSYSPIVLVILGAQMAGVRKSKLDRDSQKAFWSGLAIRILLSPILAYTLLYILGVSGTLFSVLFILASMPVAVNAVIYAEEFDAAPSIVSKCILWTTLGSLIVLPFLIEFIR